METYPDAKLMSRPGMKNGLMRRGPFSLSRMAVSAMPSNPPMPDPIRTPVRSCFSWVSAAQSASFNACVAAAIPIDDELVDLALFLRLHPIVGIELAFGQGAARNEATDLAGKIAYIEFFDTPGAAFALQQPRPTGFHPAPQGRHEAQTSDNNTAQRCAPKSDLPVTA